MVSKRDAQNFYNQSHRSLTIYDLADYLKKKGYYFIVGNTGHTTEIRLDGKMLLDLLFAVRAKEPTQAITVWHKEFETLLKSMRPASPHVVAVDGMPQPTEVATA